MDTKSALTLFRPFGFRVSIHPSWFLILMLLVWTLGRGYFPAAIDGLRPTTYWLMGVAGALGLFVSVVLHELGHSLVARSFGVPIRGITLFLFGGAAEIEDEAPTPKAELLIALAGPAVSVLIAGGGWMLWLVSEGWRVPGELRAVLGYLAVVNGLLAAFNLLPAFPLDGGRVFRSFLWRRSGSLRKATQTAGKVGEGFGLVLIGLGVLTLFVGNFIAGMWWALLGLFLRSAAQSARSRTEMKTALSGVPIRRFMNPQTVAVPSSLTVAEFVQKYVYRYHHRMFPVMNGPSVFGCAEVRKLSSIPREEWEQLRVWEIAEQCNEANSISPEIDAFAVLTVMQDTGKTRLIVKENDELLGVVSLRDLLEYLTLKSELEPGGNSHFEPSGKQQTAPSSDTGGYENRTEKETTK